MNYIGVVHKDPDSDFGVSFPDFPGCITAGRTLAEAKAMAEEALNLAIEEMDKAGEPIPAPSSLDAVLADPDFADGLAVLMIAARDLVPAPHPVQRHGLRQDHPAGVVLGTFKTQREAIEWARALSADERAALVQVIQRALDEPDYLPQRAPLSAVLAKLQAA
jgi:predicted RNase H-like HicB family nuclease